MKALETYRECLGALERKMSALKPLSKSSWKHLSKSAWKHLSKRRVLRSTRVREKGESLKERSQDDVCEK